MATTSFPPASIAFDTTAIIDECEIAEMLPNGGDPAVPVVEMAALLYLGDYVHARHLWRRHKDVAPSRELQEWWALGCALIEYDLPAVWTRLNHLQQHQPQPFCDYAQQVGASVCRRLIPKLATLWNDTSNASGGDVLLLGLPRQEWATFVDQHRKSLTEEAKKNGSESPEIISFLESSHLAV